MTPTLIQGIHNYCDRCCWRCRFADRCACASNATPRPDGEDPSLGVAASVIGSIKQAVTSVRHVARELGIDLTFTPEELAAARHEYDAKMREAKDDPLVARATEYAAQAWPILRALRPILSMRGDPVVAGAVERLEEICGTVASKIYRAVSNTLEPDFDPDLVQSDANGSAKVARLLVDDSRRAWRVLMEAGRATADGVPARLIAILDELERGLTLRFPRAFEFIRPGFDTEEPESAPAHFDAAARHAVQ
jgi:hypothetical protein